MNVSALTPEFIGSWLGYVCEGESLGVSERQEILTALAAAKAKACGYTGMTESELDGHEDITLAILGLCNDFLTNNRPEAADRAMNRMSEEILAMHCKNLL